MSSPKHYSTFKVSFTTGLVSHLQISDESVLLGKIFGIIDSTAETDTYYVQLISSYALPNDGPVSLLIAPITILHTKGTNSYFTIDLSPDYIKSKKGCFLVMSSTRDTKTITGNVMSATALYV